MDDPDFISELDGINDAKRIAPKRQRDLEDAGTEALHGFCDIRFPTIRRDCQRRK
jgi:hypothetical protein